MRVFFLPLFLLGCMPNFSPRPLTQKTRVLLEAERYSLSIDDRLNLTMKIIGPMPKESDLQKQLFLIANPRKEILAESDLGDHLPITFKKSAHATITITSKQPFHVDTVYGIYYRESGVGNAELFYVFVKKPLPPKMLTHDLGEFEPLRIEHDRILFNFHFDQPIFLQSDDAVTLSCDNDRKQIALDNLIVDDKSRLQIRIGSSSLTVGQHCSFRFNDGLISSVGQRAIIEPLEFIVDGALPKLEEVHPLKIKSSAESAELTWALSSPHHARLSIAKTENSLDCSPFPCLYKLDSVRRKKNGDDNFAPFFVNGLEALTNYDFLVLIEDYGGAILTLDGSFSTRAQLHLRISEIMINPSMPRGLKDLLGEYIEVVNIDNQEHKLDNLILTIEDNESIKQCSLPSTTLPKHSFALIVGNDYPFASSASLIRLKKNSLCGGLSNSKKKIISIEGRDGHIIDRYGAYLWKTKKGQSIQRIDVAGLDEPRNYCYSTPIEGPTPGAKNGQCAVDI